MISKEKVQELLAKHGIDKEWDTMTNDQRRAEAVIFAFRIFHKADEIFREVAVFALQDLKKMDSPTIADALHAVNEVCESLPEIALFKMLQEQSPQKANEFLAEVVAKKAVADAARQ